MSDSFLVPLGTSSGRVGLSKDLTISHDLIAARVC